MGGTLFADSFKPAPLKYDVVHGHTLELRNETKTSFSQPAKAVVDIASVSLYK
jgi:hypothetical protein